MYFSRKEMSKASEAIFREQRQIRKERLLSSPALLIGTVGFLIILFAALLVPMFSSVDPNAMTVSARFQAPGGKYLFGTDNPSVHLPEDLNLIHRELLLPLGRALSTVLLKIPIC